MVVVRVRVELRIIRNKSCGHHPSGNVYVEGKEEY